MIKSSAFILDLYERDYAGLDHSDISKSWRIIIKKLKRYKNFYYNFNRFPVEKSSMKNNDLH